MRLGMLVHDCGKLLGQEVTLGPGLHERAGTQVWKLHLRPAWVQDFESEIITWVIRNHSLLGRLNRAVTEKAVGSEPTVNARPAYPAAVDPSFVRARLAELPLPPAIALGVCAAAQKADIGSVPGLRYLLPVVDLAARLVGASESR